MKWKLLIEGFLFSFQLLSTVPIKKQIPYGEGQVRASVIFYPFVGVCIGLILFGVLYGLTQWTNVSPIVITLLLVTIGIVFSGGLHLDGWMDCSDAFFSYRSKVEKLEIMKDSRIGAFAAISLVMLLAWKTVFIYEVVSALNFHEYFIIVFIPFLARMILGLKLYFGRLARNEGMAFAMRKFLKRKDSFLYLAIVLGSLLLLGISLQNYVLYFIYLLLSGIVFYLVSMRVDDVVFGGITGDTLGATVEGGELWLWMTLYLLLSFAMG